MTKPYLSYEEYAALNKRYYAVAEGYSEIKNLKNILYSCRFFPYDINQKKKLHNHWIDGLGNSVYLGFYVSGPYQKLSKMAKYIDQDPKIDRKLVVDFDSYSLLDLNKVIRISRKNYLCVGKEVDMHNTHIVFASMGIDKYLRCYTLICGEWIKICPLRFGIEFVNKMLDKTIYTNFQNYSVLPIYDSKSWMTNAVIPDQVIKEIDKYGSFTI